MEWMDEEQRNWKKSQSIESKMVFERVSFALKQHFVWNALKKSYLR